RPVRIGLWVVVPRGYRPAGAGDLDVLIPLLATNRSPVDLQVNVIVSDLHVRDVSRVPDFHRGSINRHHLLQLSRAGGDDAILQLQSLRSHGKNRTSIG